MCIKNYYILLLLLSKHTIINCNYGWNIFTSESAYKQSSWYQQITDLDLRKSRWFRFDWKNKW